MSRRVSVVDLTSVAVQPFSERSRQLSSTRSISSGPSSSSPDPETMARGTKRKRGNDEHGAQNPASSNDSQDPVESIDLTEVEGSLALAKALAKQREDAVKAQSTAEEGKGSSMLAAYQCPVCMDTPEDATSTSCGHLFCHKCIVQYLQSIDDQRFDQGKPAKGTCPVCRKNLTRNESSGPRRSLIPLKLKLTTKKRSLVPPTEA
ncbi:uncharacterized protein N7482_007099 [Penicillium canariense]|uniref:RING-type domain-containing protein n=1 Tax=Penicillium canariense TaxID=189055 RepID=A0A9W9HYX0_9EURO|nr:uncharacterized protein N7482_007099 [Penicillium canariense]KAJ5160095.1 hypothetical protein N7482_007099 [Penicillium canariense]